MKVCNKKWIGVNDLSGLQYSTNKNLMFKTTMPRSDLCNTVMHISLKKG